MDLPEERIDRLFVHHGLGSYRSIRTFIRRHIIEVNGQRVTEFGYKVSSSRDKITIDGKELKLLQDVYLMMNKCQDTVCTSLQGSHKRVFDIVDEKYLHPVGLGELHTVGRLDLDTEGLLILTTNGSFSHRLTMPEYHVPKTYLVCLRNAVSDEERKEYIERCMKGLHLEAEKKAGETDVKNAVLEWVDAEEAKLEPCSMLDSVCKLTITEGKFHQVKRMFKALGNEVIFLRRIAMGNLKLDESLRPGEYREMTIEEICLLSQ
ncbi:MAG: pseudouridine synthase [Treponema sp.]|nr:pseudouridine synthase [Treponema sp.]